MSASCACGFSNFLGGFFTVEQRVDVHNKIKIKSTTQTQTQFHSYKHTPQMIKRLCRKLGMPRWPYRQIDSINKAMEDLHDQLEGARNEADRARYNMCFFFGLVYVVLRCFCVFVVSTKGGLTNNIILPKIQHKLFCLFYLYYEYIKPTWKYLQKKMCVVLFCCRDRASHSSDHKSLTASSTCIIQSEQSCCPVAVGQAVRLRTSAQPALRLVEVF